MSEKRVLTIDPNMFSFSKKRSSSTRKKSTEPKEKKERVKKEPKIRVKTGDPEKKTTRTDTLKKKSILKMIRQHQEDRYKKLFVADSDDKPKKKEADEDIDSFNSDFKEAQTFLENLTIQKERDKIKNYANTTLKKYPSQLNTVQPSLSTIPTTDLLNVIELDSIPVTNTFNPNIDVGPQNYQIFNNNNGLGVIELEPFGSSQIPIQINNLEPLDEVTHFNLDNLGMVEEEPYIPAPRIPLPHSIYGCLKGGVLPTYRKYMNKTLKNVSGNNNDFEENAKKASHMKQIIQMNKNKKKEREKKKRKKKRKKY